MFTASTDVLVPASVGASRYIQVHHVEPIVLYSSYYGMVAVVCFL